MALSILATADFHLGLRYAPFPEAQRQLVEARFACLERLVTVANDRRCDLFLVAGDLFDRVGVPKADVLRAVKALRRFEGRLVALLPGNHDYLSPGEDTLWTQLEAEAGDRILVLKEPRPYPLAHFDVDACLYPGPCHRRHSDANAIGWVKDTRRDPGVRTHIGVAHGSLAGFSPDMEESYYPMETAELLAAGPDFWVVGHTHVRYPERAGQGERVFIPGTPEPTGFDCSHAGVAWLLAIEDRGAVAAEALETGRYRFVREDLEASDQRALEGMVARYAGPDAATRLVKVRLSGRLSRADRQALADAEAALRGRVAWLEWRDEDVREELTAETIDEAWPQDSFPHRLLTRLLGDAEALEAASDLLEKARG